MLEVWIIAEPPKEPGADRTAESAIGGLVDLEIEVDGVFWLNQEDAKIALEFLQAGTGNIWNRFSVLRAEIRVVPGSRGSS